MAPAHEVFVGEPGLMLPGIKLQGCPVRAQGLGEGKGGGREGFAALRHSPTSLPIAAGPSGGALCLLSHFLRLLQVIRQPLLELVTHMVVANGSMADLCMQLLVSSLFIMKPPQASEDLCTSFGWEPKPEELIIQDDVLACLRKVRLHQPFLWFYSNGWTCPTWSFVIACHTAKASGVPSKSKLLTGARSGPFSDTMRQAQRKPVPCQALGTVSKCSQPGKDEAGQGP